jgi:branched-chain amino acid transport system permease protein
MSFFIQNLINGLSIGSLYALIGLGIALIFGIMRLVNFAHGELIMAGGFVLYLLTYKTANVPAPVYLLAVLLSVALLALAMDRVAFRPLRSAPASTLLIGSFAVSYLLQHVALAIFGDLPQPIVFPAVVGETFTVEGLLISKIDIATIVVTLVLLVGLASFLKKTPIGVQMRAAAEDFTMARALGVRADRVIAVAFALSGILAGIVSIFYLAKIGTVVPTSGFSPVLIGLVAVVVGGLGSLVGAVVGGIVLGLVTIMAQAYLPADLVAFRDAFVFGSAILILLLRPQGLLVARAQVQRI